MLRKALYQQSTSRLVLQPSTPPILQNAAPKIASILNSFSDDDDDTTTRHEGTEQLLVEESSSSLNVNEEELKQWQTLHLPILTNLQLKMSLIEIERRRKLKQQSTQRRRDDQQSANNSKMTLSSSNNNKKQEAAILIPLCTVQGTPSILFTRRSATLSNHASQISFPGGYYDETLDGMMHNHDDDGDDDDDRLVNTALRETQEELCYNIDQFPTSSSLFTILGRTQPVPSMQGKKVTPIIGMCNYNLPHHSTNEFESIFPGNPDEVDWIFTIPIRELMEGETSEPLERWSTSYNSNDKGKKMMKKNVVLGPAFHIPECSKKRDGDKIWGLTAIVLRPLLKKVFGPVFCGDGSGGNAKL